MKSSPQLAAGKPVVASSLAPAPGAAPNGRLTEPVALPGVNKATHPDAPLRRWRHFGLRSRVTTAFALGAALLSGALAGTTYGLVHHYLLDEQEAAATRQAYSHARVMQRDLAHGGANLGEALSSLTETQGTTAFLYCDGVWYSASVSIGQSSGTSRPGSLPPALAGMVTGGEAARQRVITGGEPALAVGIPLPTVSADYFEIDSLSDLARTLDLLAWVLFTCSVATTAAGLLVGRWASGRLVRPLRSIAGVAGAIAGGSLDRRLPPSEDPDLVALVTSFNGMVEALEERIKRDAQLASDVSHELRSPLTTIQASVEVLERSYARLGRDERKALSLLSAEIRRFSTMVQDLLEMSRFDAGAAGLDLEDVALDDLVANTVAAYTEGEVPVVVTEAGAGAWLAGDRRRLQRVLVNLLDNARTHAGGAVRVSVDRRGDEAEVAVEDAGPGVHPAERRAIFERFYRGAAAGRRAAGSGTGLGLALVAEHVKAHHGEIEVGDRAGGGARFVVRLPLGPLSLGPEGMAPEAMAPEAMAPEAMVPEGGVDREWEAE